MAVALGLSGGHLSLDDDAKVGAVIEAIRTQCDTDGDGLVDRSEATACAEYLYGQLMRANEQRLLHAQKAAASASSKLAGGRTEFLSLVPKC